MIGDDDLAFLDETWREPAHSGGGRGGKVPLILLGALLASRSGNGPRPVAGAGGGSSRRDRLERIARRAPEVMVKVTGSQRGGGHTLAHLDYIARHGKLEIETEDGEIVRGRANLQDIASEWEEEARAMSDRREPVTSVSMVLSMPPGSDPQLIYQAARAFAHVELDGFPHVMALHTDTGHPHVHVTVAARNSDGLRFHPEKADLARFRHAFARELRARGVDAEATPRRARGVVQKHERTPVRKQRERWEQGRGSRPAVLAASDRAAMQLASENEPKPRPWEVETFSRQASVREAYEKAASKLAASGSVADRRLAADVRQFVKAMPEPATRDREKMRAIRVREQPQPLPARVQVPPQVAQPTPRDHDRDR